MSVESAPAPAAAAAETNANPLVRSAPSSSPPPGSPPPVKKQKNAVASSSKIDYRNSVVLAPMVRSGQMPSRLLSLLHGVDLVWSPETVDRAVIGSTRTVDDTGMVRYWKNDVKSPIFYCHPIEKPYLIYQLGTASPELAVKAAKMVEDDVAGFDLNCGCPKPFSTLGGMGAALLDTPDLLCDILRALIENTDKPVSCKIRLLPDQAKTLELVEKICSTGISALTVHARTRSMRDREPALRHRLRDIVDLVESKFGIPVIANGDAHGRWELEQIRKDTGVSSIMIARAAENNPSCFRVDTAICNQTYIIPQLVKWCKYFDNPWKNTRFMLGQYSPSPPSISKIPTKIKKSLSQQQSQSKDIEHVAQIYDIKLPEEGEDVLAELRLVLARKERFREEGNGEVSMVNVTPIEKDYAVLAEKRAEQKEVDKMAWSEEEAAMAAVAA